MNADKESSRSVWLDMPFPKAGRLTANLKTDVLVIGGGIAGLSTAYELAAAGREVVVVDRGPIGGGMTARTSAHLSWEIDETYARLIDAHGKERSRRYLASQREAVDRIETICREEKIACDFARLDLFLFAPDAKGRGQLERELEACQTVGFEGVTWAEAPVAGDVRGCLRFPNQARFHALAYAGGLARAIKRYGGRLFSNAPVVSVEEQKTGTVAKTSDGTTIRARSTVVATNSPFVNRMAVHTKQAPYRSYVISVEMPARMQLDALIWDTADPYHYVRAHERGSTRLLIVGGEDHRTGKEDDGAKRIERLQAWTRERFPETGKLRDAWSGQIYEPVDYIPFIGRSPGHDRIYIVTGDSGEGLTTGVVASLLLSDMIAGWRNPWSAVYNPSRKIPKKPKALTTYVKDWASATVDLVGKISSATTTAADIGRNAGAVVEEKKEGGEKEKIAAYRDGKGRLHRRSAACTHAGCTVAWNSFEACWDCPCHGSHFAVTGEAIQCPAVAPLEKA